jgi:hypothetical protein
MYFGKHVVVRDKITLISGKSAIPFKGLSREIEGIPYRVRVSKDLRGSITSMRTEMRGMEGEDNMVFGYSCGD